MEVPCVRVIVATPVAVLELAVIFGAGTPILKLLPVVVLMVATPVALIVTFDAGNVTVFPPEIDKLFPETARVGDELMV